MQWNQSFVKLPLDAWQDPGFASKGYFAHFYLNCFLVVYIQIHLYSCQIMAPQQQKSLSVEDRMRLSSDFCKFFRRAYDMFGDVQLFAGKSLSTTTYWFYIDALYYYLDTKEDFKAVNQVRRNQKCLPYEFEELQDLEYILKLRKLVSDQKLGTLNINDIRSTSTDEVIDILSNHLAQIESENTQKIDLFKKRYSEQEVELASKLKNFGLRVRQSHPMFKYEEFESELRQRWVKQDIKAMSKQRCYLCSLPHRLITCKSCALKVHPACYPTFSCRYDSKSNRPTEEELKNFTCENCLNGLDFENEKCQICCCLGGYFVKIGEQGQAVNIRLLRENGAMEHTKSTQIELKVENNEQKTKQKYIHLSCFIWNTELKWYDQKNRVSSLANLEKKKINSMCSLCGISFGAAIPCTNQSCRRFYHGECARRHKLQMNLIRAKTSVIELYCQRHRHLNRYESLEESSLNRFRELKKMFENIDKQIKRLNVTASYQQVKLVVERDYCSVCGKEEGWQKITICKQCRKWYHNACSSNCKNCA